MPDFGTAPVIESLSQISASFIGASGRRTTTIGSDYATADVTLAEVQAWAEALGQISNAGLYRYQGIGVRREIAVANALIADELHGIERSLVLVFQKGDTLETARFNVPAPDASLFVGRFQMRALDDVDQGARLTAAVTAYSNIINVATPAAGTAWVLVNGFLDNAPKEVRQSFSENYFEPAAGTPSAGPGA